ncbi:MAG: DMT family transporter [Oscillospiraceae bacterium]|nr:DMT family transporter [Oscillospiraceae bacterium]
MKHSFLRQVVAPTLAAFIWGTAFVAQSVCSRYIPPFAFNACRSFIAVAFLIPLSRCFDAVAAKRRTPPPKTDRRTLITGGIVCGLVLAGATNLQQAGIADTTAGKAGFITAFYVVLVPVLGVLMGRKSVLRIWISVAFAGVGLWLLCIKAGERFHLVTGDIFLIICAVLYALQIYAIDRYVQVLDGIKLSCAQFVVAGTVALVLSLCFERFDPANLLLCILPILYVGVLSSGVAYTLQTLSQKGSNPVVVTLLFSLESVFAVLAGAVILGDRLTPREYGGCALMFVAVILAELPLEKLFRKRSRAAE